MHIASVEFIVGAVGARDLPADGLPEVAFSGRSNVGKSSLINRLVQRKSLARTSSTPGKTQQLNYYCVNRRFYLVDLPGYGYVKGGAALRRKLGKLTATYVEQCPQLRAVVQLVDARHGPTDLDLEMVEWLQQRSKPFLLVFTKADKLTRNKMQQRFAALEREGKLAGLSFAPFSAISGQGTGDIWKWITDAAGI